MKVDATVMFLTFLMLRGGHLRHNLHRLTLALRVHAACTLPTQRSRVPRARVGAGTRTRGVNILTSLRVMTLTLLTMRHLRSLPLKTFIALLG
jgi:hypothetical protein